MKKPISQAVIIMAGSGSRLRRSGEDSPKPLVDLAGRPLISYTMDGLLRVGIKTIYAVIGFESARLRAGLTPLIPRGVALQWIENPNWQKQNGITLLAAAPFVNRPFILTMGDHIFEPRIFEVLIQRADLNLLNVAVERKLDAILDLDDAMKIKTRGGHVVAVGKNLEDYDAIDTGLFVCVPEIFRYLDRAKRDEDCSLADGVRLMAADGKVHAVDIGGAWWQDVDSVATLQHARQLIATYYGSSKKVAQECIVLADAPGALIELCGISLLERLLRSLQRCGFKRAVILSSTRDVIAQEVARPSWARADLECEVHARASGPVMLEQIIDLWPNDTDLLMIVPADSVFDLRLLRMLASRFGPAALVDSSVPDRFHSLVQLAPATKRGKLCGPAFLQRDWAHSRTGLLQEAVCTGLDNQTLAAADVATEPLYYAPLNRELRAYWFPAPSPADAQLAKRIILDSAQKGTLDLPATVHAPIETFLISRLCETPVTPHQLTIITNVVAWSATILLATGRLGWGLGLAVLVGVLDGLDGKQARVKVETSKRGKLEHWFDAIFEVSWWIAFAYYLQHSGRLPDAFRYLALLLIAQGIDGMIKSGVRYVSGRSIEELGTFERTLHFVSGRRNVFVWLLTIGFLLGAPTRAFVFMTWLALATAILHLPRAIAVFSRFRKAGRPQP